VLTGEEMVRVLEKAGFLFDRQNGSHRIMWHPQLRRAVTVPVHAGETLSPKTLSSILRQAGLTADDLRDLLRKK